VQEAGAVVVGGHSVKDVELKYGIAATGIIDPDRIITNANAQPGDILFLTKPLGTGLITTGIKRNKVDPQLTDIVVAQMEQLNKCASELMLNYDTHAATDITGYGLMGHAFEMAAASEVTFRIMTEKLPLMPMALELAEAGMVPGGANANREFMKGRALVDSSVDENMIRILYDPQTSGGLLIAISEEDAGQFEEELASQKIFGQAIGEVLSQKDYPIIVVK